MRKIIILSISILVTLVGTILLGIYDFNVWLAPTGKNGTNISSEYRGYLIEELVDFKNNETAIQNTQDKINLSRVLSNYKYSEEPIYHNENDLFTIDIYVNQFWYVNSDLKQEFDHYRYEIFIYNVNYDLLKSKFKEQSVPSKATIDEAAYPHFVINFYPNEEYNVEEALIYPKKGESGEELDKSTVITLYNDEQIISQSFAKANSITLFDYSSTPTKDMDGNEFSVNYLQMYDYSTYVGQNETLYYDNRDLFLDGCYIKIDAILEIQDGDETINYMINGNVLKDKVEDFTFDTSKISSMEFKDGFTTSSNVSEMLRGIKIEGVKSYDSWVIGKYLWWHCLCAFVIIGVFMTGFYFIFSYEEKGKTKGKKKIKKSKK